MEMPRSRTLPDLLDEMAARYPDREAVVAGDERLTYPQYRARVHEVAKGLHRLGVRPGEKVALLMGNRLEWLLTDFAVAMLGATLVPVSTWSRARELDYVLRHADATTLITVDRFLGQDYLAMLAEIGAGTRRFPVLRHLVCVAPERHRGLTAFGDLAALGAAVPDREIDALRLIERERCTVYYGTPNIALALTEHPDRRRCDLRSLRTGAAIGSAQAMQMVMELGAAEICNVYGLTECYGNCTVTDAHDPVDVRLHTVGRPLPGTEIKIADPRTHQPLPPGEVGEIAIRGYRA